MIELIGSRRAWAGWIAPVRTEPMATEEHERLTALELVKAPAFADKCDYWRTPI